MPTLLIATHNQARPTCCRRIRYCSSPATAPATTPVTTVSILPYFATAAPTGTAFEERLNQTDLRLTKRLDPGLDVEAVKALRRWRFAPGLRNGQPVPVQVTIEQVFTLK